MVTHNKLQSAKPYLNGSRSMTDLGIFWHRPRAWIGSESVNRTGLQILRAAYQRLTHRPSLKSVSPELREQAKALIESGMIVIPDFLPQEVFDKIRDEYNTAFDPNRETIVRKAEETVNKRSNKYSRDSEAITSVLIRGVCQESCKLTAELSPTALQHIVNNKTIWELASAATGKKIKYRPGAYFQREKRAPDGREDTEQNILLHEDVFYPSLKAFFYINDNTVENGAFVVVPKTQRLDIQRLKHEYLYSLDIARQKKGKSISHPQHESGRMQVFGRTYKKEELKEVQAVGKANTLILANTMAFHRRGGSSVDEERQQIRMCFRHVETLHHFLYPHFDTRNSKRYQATEYY